MSAISIDLSRILVVDDDPTVGQMIQEEFEDQDHHVEVIPDPDIALELVKQQRPGFVLVDLQIAVNNGFAFLRGTKEVDQEIVVIVLSGYTEPERVAEALQLGAEDCIAKPFDPAVIQIAMKNIHEKRNLRDQVSCLKGELERDHAFGMLVGETPEIVSVREFIEQVAGTDLNILIRGESGTGKDVTSRLVHQLSGRSDGPFVKVNCAALPENLIESELFGYEKGAFTGAIRAKPGRF